MDADARFVVVQEARGLDHGLWVVVLAFCHIVGQLCFQGFVLGAVGSPKDHACKVSLAAVGLCPL